MNKKDLTAGIVFLAIGAVLYTHASTFPVKEGASLVLSPGFYPKLLSVIMGILSLLLIFEAVKKKESDEDCETSEKVFLFKTRGGRIFLLALGLLVLYPFVLEYLGFATAAFLFIFILILALTEDAKSHLIPISGISLFITTVMYVVFKVILHIPFPDGLLI